MQNIVLRLVAKEGDIKMPLVKGAKPGSPGFKKNIKEEIKVGKPRNQALAIAYSEAKAKQKKKK